jgi:dihydrofolate reductase
MVGGMSTEFGKVVVNRSMSLDGFIAGPGDAMDWIFDFMAPVEQEFPEVMAATGAMLIGRRTYEVAKRMADGPNPPGYDGGAEFVLTHEPPDPPDPASPGLARIDLEPLDSTRSGAVNILRFRVRK